MQKFIQYLDSYKNADMHPSNYHNILFNINSHYLENNIYHPHFSGGIDPTNVYKLPYYQIYPPIQQNDNAFNLWTSPYMIWQNNHEIHPECSLPTEPVKIHNVTIDAKIEKIQDLIELADKHPYTQDTEYNIDLKSIHNIYDDLKSLNNMIGMENMKQSILDQLLYFIQNLHVGKESDFKHTVLFGPPGTGKTEIAKLIGSMYSKLGILKNNVFKKVTRNDLIAGYLGQTAIKTTKVIESCLGGVLFIDEAYSLADYSKNDSFSKECIDTICEALSNHKDDLMVIIAGYEDELNNTFFMLNTGLESRFIWKFKMDPYSSKELMRIFLKKVKESEWTVENIEDTIFFANLAKWFEKHKDHFKHCGRDMELLFTYTKISHGRRIYGKSNELRKIISMQDLEKGHGIFIKNMKKKEESSVFKNMYI